MAKNSLDWEECLRLSNNNESAANELLAMFKSELPDFQSGLKSCMESGNQEELQSYSHKLCGACCYVGAPQLKQLVEQLELQIKMKKQDQLKDLINQINEEISEVLKAIETHKKFS